MMTGRLGQGQTGPRRRSGQALHPAVEPLEPRLLLGGGQIHGMLWEDLDGDGLRGALEAGLDGWTVELIDPVSGQVVAAAGTESRDADGDGSIDPQTEVGLYAFADVAAGSYELRCGLVGGFQQTWPPLRYAEVLSEQETLYHPNAVNLDFAGALPPAGGATLTVSAVADLDGAEEYLWIEAEGADLGTLFAADGRQYEPVTETLQIGEAELADLADDGTIRLTVRASPEVSDLLGPESLTVEIAYAATGRHAVQVAEGAAAEGLDFGVFALGEIRGAKWNDLNRDGVRDAGEPGIDGWTMELLDGATAAVLATAVTASVDLNGDGSIDPAGEQGVYVFEQLGAGPLEVRSAVRSGWRDSAPPGGSRAIALESGETLSGVDFGGFQLAEVRGQVWQDANGDAVRDAGEVGLDDWTVELLDGASGAVLATAVTAGADLNGDGSIDPYSERGRFAFEEVLPGGYEVRLVARSNWSQTFPAEASRSLELTNGQVAAGVDFACRAELGEIAGFVWQDLDGDGTRGPDEPGADGIIVELVGAEDGSLVASAMSESRDADGDGQIDPLSESGRYRFSGVTAGRYELRVQVPQGWLKTAPPEGFQASRSEANTLFNPSKVTFDFVGAPPPASDAVLTISAVADLDGEKEYLRVLADGALLGYVFVDDGLQYLPVQTAIDIPQADLEALTDDGTVSITVQPSLAVDDLGGSESLTVELAYLSTGVHAIQLGAGQVVQGRGFGLAPPLSNAPPVLTNVQTLAGAVEDEPFAISYAALAAAADEADPDEQPITFRVEILTSGTLSKAGSPAWAGVTLLGPGEELTWLPPADANGTLGAFRVKAWDGLVASVMPVQVSVEVAPVNDPPVLTTIEPLTGGAEDEPFIVTYEALAGAADEADVDGDAIQFRVASVVSGSLTKAGGPAVPGVTLLGAGESLTWQPAPRASGTLEAFEVVAWDGQSASAEAVLVRVRVAGENDPPVLTTIETLTGAAEDADFTIAHATLLAASDAADPDGQEIQFRVESLGSGTLTQAGVPVLPGATLLGPGQALTWRAPADGHGLFAAFAVVAWDGEAASALPVAVAVEVAAVNDAPVAADDSAETQQDTPVTTGNVLDNDADVDGDALTVASFTQPAEGSVVYNDDGTFTYAPGPGFSGADGFTYTVADGNGGTDTAAVTVAVGSTNDPPVAADDSAETEEDTPVTTASVLDNDTDADGDALIVSAFTQPASGSAAYNADGTFTYTPAADFNGPDGFTYTVSDGNGGFDTAAVAVTVAPVNDPPAAGDDAAATYEGTPVTTPDVLANDTDVDGDALAVAAFTQPAHGSATYNGDGTFTYAPEPGFSGPDGFTYTVSDGNGGEDEGAVVLTVAAVAGAPLAADDSAWTDEDTPVTTPDVLANDAGDGALAVVAFTQPAHGSVAYNGDGTFTYAPEANFNGLDGFTYTIANGGGGESTATVSLAVAPVNDPPHADDRTHLAYAGELAWIFLTGSDLETDEAELSFAIAAGPAHGTLTLSGNVAVYASDGEVGPDAFSFTVTDAGETTDLGASGPLSSAPATVALIVAPPLTSVSMAAGRSNVLSYTDADGTAVRLALKGDGSAKVGFDGLDVQYHYTSRGVLVTGEQLLLRQIVLSGTSARSSLTIKTDRGGDGRAEVGGVSAYGPLKAVVARSTDLTGDLIVAGTVRKLALGDVAGGVRIDLNIGGAPAGPKDSATLSFDRVAGSLLETHGLAIRSLTAAEWIDAGGAAGAGRIRAPRLDRLAIKGRRGNPRKGLEPVAGDFAADLVLDGSADARRPALGNARVAGSVRGADWLVAGEARAVRIDGEVDGWTFRPGGVRSLALGNVHQAEVVVADALQKAKVLRWSGGRLEADSINALRVTGRRGSRARGAAIAGDFGAELLLRGQAVPDGKPALKSVQIAGDLTGSAWRVGGQIGRIAVAGSAEGSTIRARGSIASVSLGAAAGSDVLAGVVDNGGRRAETPSDFADPSAEIRSLQIRGRKLTAGEPIPRFLVDSNFSAASFGSVSLLNAGAGEPFGLFALGGDGGEVGSLRYRDTLTGESWSWRPGEPLPVVGGFLVDILT